MPSLVVVRRAAHLRRNPGEIAFPGGIVDPGDADSEAAALREFEEELGLSRDRVRIVERLGDVITLSSTVTVAPYVGLIDPPVAFRHDTAETAGVHEIPLAAIYAPGALHRGVERIETSGTIREVPSWVFDYRGLHIWGATARMLADLVARYRDPGTLASMT